MLSLEVDMGTESHIRLAAKIGRCLAYRESGLFRDCFGGRSLRLLIVAPSVTRLRTHKRLTQSQAGRRMFGFAPLGGITAERIVEPI